MTKFNAEEKFTTEEEATQYAKKQRDDSANTCDYVIVKGPYFRPDVWVYPYDPRIDPGKWIVTVETF